MMITSDFRPEVEIRQFHSSALRNDSVGHNGLMQLWGRYHVSQNVFLVVINNFTPNAILIDSFCRHVFNEKLDTSPNFETDIF